MNPRPRDPVEETIYRLDGPLRWALGEAETLLARVGVPPGARSLDVGAGTGYLTLPLARAVGAAGHVVALEPSPRLRQVLAHKAAAEGLAERLRLDAGQAEELPYEDGTFDLVVSSYLLHELGERAPRALAEMYRVLKPLGRVALADYRRIPDDQRRRAIEAWYGAQPDGGGDDERHLRFSVEDVESMLSAAGFRGLELATWADFHVHAQGRK